MPANRRCSTRSRCSSARRAAGVERAPTPLAMGTQPLNQRQTPPLSASGSAQVYTAPAEAASGSADRYVERRTSPMLIIGVIVRAGAGDCRRRLCDHAELRAGTPTQAAAMPTPFAEATTVRRGQYTISVPDDWSFVDLSNELGLVHVWQSGTQAISRCGWSRKAS